MVKREDRLLEVIAKKIGEDPIKRDILLELENKEFAEMADIYREISLKHGIDYPRFFSRIRTLTNGGLIDKIKPGRSGIGNRVFLELTEKGRKVVELLKRS